MERFIYLDHTADVKFQAYGKNLEEAFANAALATTNVITDVNAIKPKIQKEIVITSKTKESLLYDFLDELIFLLDTELFMTCNVKEIKIEEKIEEYNGFRLTAKIEGDSIKHYKTTGDIKAPTYNFMFIKEEEEKTTIQVVLDL